MGILNVTPDSFSDGGEFLGAQSALARGLEMARQGADIIDIGAESTRPGAARVDQSEQLRRLNPVIEHLRAELPAGCSISIDTTRAEVAKAAALAGAVLVNDISSGTDDPEMFPMVSSLRLSIVLMHMKGTPATMQDNPRYQDVVGEVLAYLVNRAEQAIAAGIPKANIAIDPGIGFGKRRVDNLRLLANLDRFADSGFPVVLGTSRKRFMGAICGQLDPTELVGATVATTALGVAKGARIFRVHDVAANRQAADVIAAIVAESQR
jgi:dihydropteroate synthase